MATVSRLNGLAGPGRGGTDMGDEAERITSRVGFLGHGILYLLLAVAAGRLALGSSSQGDASASGAISSLAEQPLGRVILAPIAVAFACYGLYRGVRAVRDEEWYDRISQAFRSLVWAGLATLTAVNVVRGSQGSSSSEGATAAVLSWPGGQLLIGAVGLAVVLVGGYQAWTAIAGDLGEELQELGLGERRAVRWLGGTGYLGRGLAYTAVGGFIVRAAITHETDSGQGLDAALEELRQGRFGLPLLLLVTVGFAAFGLFRLVESRYRFSQDGDDAGIEGE